MKTKNTEELKHEISAVTDIADYLKRNQESLIHDSLSGYLNIMLSKKGVSKADVVRGSLLSRAYVYQIFSGEKMPSRDKLIAIAFGLHLSDVETQALLKLSKNRELYARDERDAIILFALQRNKSVLETNGLLFELGYKVLGIPEE